MGHRMIVIAILAMVIAGTCFGQAHAQGPRGPRAAALIDWELVQTEEFALEPNSSAELFAPCPDGKVPLGGGFAKSPVTPDSAAGFEVAGSFPGHFVFEGHLNSGWFSHVINRGPATVFVSAFATCAAESSRTFH